MRIRLILALVPLAAAVHAQTTDSLIAELEREVIAQRRLLSDWAGLTRYGSDNSELRLLPGEDRVVFLGDEIVENWGEGKVKFFPGKPYLNRGIARQTTPQMLVRFRQDVIALKPKAVIIQASSNDMAGNAGPITESMSGENIMSMTELAKANGIRVILASVTPVCDCAGVKVTSRRTIGKIIGLNGWLKEYAARSGSIYLNYHSALVEGRTLKRDFTVDGLLISDAGYEVMAPLAEQAIAQALAK